MDKTTNKQAIWLVEDEEDLLSLIHYTLMKEGYEVRGFGSGEELLSALALKLPDLLLLDLMLPGVNGLEICQRLKSWGKTCGIPVIMLTAKAEEADIVTGLNLGADDYIAKPFSPKVLIARVRSVLRRQGQGLDGQEEVIRQGDMVIDPNRHQVLLAGASLPLTVTEFKILHFLAKKPGWVFSRDQIISAVHDSDFAVTDRTVDVQVVALRRKLGGRQNCIQTVRGIGYKFEG